MYVLSYYRHKKVGNETSQRNNPVFPKGLTEKLTCHRHIKYIDREITPQRWLENNNTCRDSTYCLYKSHTHTDKRLTLETCSLWNILKKGEERGRIKKREKSRTNRLRSLCYLVSDFMRFIKINLSYTVFWVTEIRKTCTSEVRERERGQGTERERGEKEKITWLGISRLEMTPTTVNLLRIRGPMDNLEVIIREGERFE